VRAKASPLRRKVERGVALIISLLVLLVLSALGASVIFATQTEIWSTANYRLLVQARYIAEAGAERAANWIMYTYTAPASFSSFDMAKNPVAYNGRPVLLSAMDGVSANYPDSTVQSAFDSALRNRPLPGMGVNATYGVTAKLLRMQVISAAFSGSPQTLQTWEITSQGNIAGVRNAQFQVVLRIERTGRPLLNYGAFATATGCATLILSGGGVSDSFDSSQGSYAATHQNSNGNIGSNGNISLSGGGGVLVYGTAETPNTGTGTCNTSSPNAITLGGGATVSGGLVQLPQSVVYPPPSAPSPAPPTTSQNIRNNCATIAGCTTDNGSSGPFHLAPGSYGNASLGGGKILHLQAGTYNFNSLSLSGGSILTVDSGPVMIHLAGAGLSSSTAALDFSGGGIANPSQTPSDLQILYGGSNPVKFSGGSDAYAILYTPGAPVTIGGGGDLYGAVVGSTINNSGGTSIHYDRSLQTTNFCQAGSYQAISFSGSKF